MTESKSDKNDDLWDINLQVFFYKLKKQLCSSWFIPIGFIYVVIEKIFLLFLEIDNFQLRNC